MADSNQSMIDNLPTTTGRSIDEWFTVLRESGLEKHTELQNLLKEHYGVSHGFANGIALRYRSQGASTEEADLVDAQFAGAKAALRPIYDSLISAVSTFGHDVEVSAKKASVSLRRAKQFALIEAPSAKRIQLGIQLKGEATTERLLASNAMCSHKVILASTDEVDDELVGWLRSAYDRAG